MHILCHDSSWGGVGSVLDSGAAVVAAAGLLRLFLRAPLLLLSCGSYAYVASEQSSAVAHAPYSCTTPVIFMVLDFMIFL